MIACIYEGGAEKAVLDMLMENECLYFSKDDLLSGDFIRRVSGKVFASRFLGYSIKENSIDLIRVQDSRRADLGLPSTYRCKIRSEVKCLTRPEIEMLVIIAEDCHDDFQKRRMKPSIYCKDVLGLPEVKTYGFFRSCFSDIDLLLKTIKRYDELFPSRVVGEMSLYDLLNEGAKRRIQNLK